jgi:hypothetical protein
MSGDYIPRHSELDLETTQTDGIIELENRRYATTGGLARMLGVAPRTLVRWDERRIGPPKIKVGKLVLYDLTKLNDWLETHESGSLMPPKRGRSR